MNRRIRAAAVVFSLALVLALPGARADSAVVLNDGQVIRGTDVTRQGDSYLVTMAGGNIATFPAELVKEIRLEDATPPANPNVGIYATTPKTLAGPGPSTYASQDPKDQLAVFGPPTQWSKSAVDTTVVPVNAYDPSVDVMAGSRTTWSKSAVDTTYVPKDAYDTSKDVMAGSRSTWSKDAVDTSWKPTDGFGFKPLSAKGAKAKPVYPMSFAAPAPVEVASTAAKGPTPWTCGESIFADESSGRAAGLAVRPLKGAAYASLGIPLYVAEGRVGTTTRRAVFAIASGECRLVGGDAGAIRGMNLGADLTMAQDAASLNAAIASHGRGLPQGVDKLDYAFAFVSVADSEVSGSSGAKLVLISKPEELRTITQATPKTCTLPKSRKRKEARVASAAYVTPKIVSSKDGDVVTFLTWSSAGGSLYRNTVILGRDGVVSSKRELAASHVGAHVDAAGTATGAVAVAGTTTR